MGPFLLIGVEFYKQSTTSQSTVRVVLADSNFVRGEKDARFEGESTNKRFYGGIQSRCAESTFPAIVVGYLLCKKKTGQDKLLQLLGYRRLV